VLNQKLNEESVFLRHEPCNDCGSTDNVGRYLNPDNTSSTYCFGCGAYHSDTAKNQNFSKYFNNKTTEMIEGEYEDLIKRKISAKTCKLFNYQVGTHNNQTVHIANYNNKDGLAAQHIRYPNKDFIWIGNTKELQLFGQSQWRDKGKIVVTEGEIDAMSVSTVHNNRYPVVSIPNGVKAAAKSVAANIEWLEGFNEVIFMFDSDTQGYEAAVECCNLITPSKAKIAKLPLKDASDVLVAGRGSEITDAIFNAKVFRPDGIISGEDTWDLLTEVSEHQSVNYPWNGLTEMTGGGLRRGELVTFCGGSGIGKSQVTKEICFDLIRKDEKVGVIALEENVQRSIRSLVGLALNKPIHLPEVYKTIPEKELKKAWKLVSKNCFFYDSWGSTDDSNLLNKIRYLAQACECKWIILDHISIVVSALDLSSDERRTIDMLMTKLRGLVENLKIGLIIVSHLRRPVNSNRGHEEGASVSLSHLRSSHAIAQLSDIVCSLSRNMSEGDNATEVRVLKNRFTGETGLAATLVFNKETFRMTEANVNFQEENTNDDHARSNDY